MEKERTKKKTISEKKPTLANRAFKWLVAWAQSVLIRFNQFILVLSISIGGILHRALSYPKAFAPYIGLGMLFGDIPHTIVASQAFIAVVSIFLSGGVSRMSRFTKVLFVVNLGLTGLHLNHTRIGLKAFHTFKETLEKGKISPIFLRSSPRVLPPSKLSSLGPVSPFIASLLAMIPFLDKKKGKGVRSYKEKMKYYENKDHDQELETKPYTNMEIVDPKLKKQLTDMKKVTSKFPMLGRGHPLEWQELDIIRNKHVLNSEGQTFPVLIYVHGGGWVTGDKLFALAGSLDFLVSRFNIVLVKINYRLAPERTLPEQLLDIKRAIYWVKNNISKYKGNPDQLCLGGESAGGHLAAMTGLTNETYKFSDIFSSVLYKEDLEEVLPNSSVNCIIDIYGVHQYLKDDNTKRVKTKRKSTFFLKRNLSLQAGYKDNQELYDSFAPTKLLLKSFNKDCQIPPFMMIHGTLDELTSYTDAKEFFHILKRFRFKNKGTEKDIFVTLDKAHHATGYIYSPRAVSIALGMASFMNSHFEVRKAKARL